MKIHCDECGRYLGDYLYGKGGVSEIASVSVHKSPVSMPDVTCFRCLGVQPRIALSAPEAQERIRIYKNYKWFKGLFN